MHVTIILATLLSLSCASTRAYKRGQRAERAERYSEAVRQYSEAVALRPDDPRYRLALSSALIKSGDAHLERGEAFERGGEIELAYREYCDAAAVNPLNERALLKRDQMRKRLLAMAEPEKKQKEPPIVSPLVALGDAVVNLRMTDAELTEVLGSIERLTGVTIVYDEAFKSRKVNVAFQQMTFKDVLERLMTVYHCFYKPIDPHTILIANDSEAKRAEYEEQLLKTFYLYNADPAKVAANLKSMVELKRVMVNPELKAITVRDSAEKLELARRLIEKEDMRRAEVVVDLEILEFNRNRLSQFGLDLSSYGVGGAVALDPVTQFPAGTMIRGHMLGHIEVSDLLFSIPSVVYRLLRTDTRTRLIARPQLRCAEGETVSVKIGERIPLPVTAFVSVLGGGGVPAQPIVSYQMEQVGLQIELTPTVHLNEEVTLKAKFELTSVVREGTVTVPPTLGNRLVTSTIRLRDGETTLVAGLIREEDRKSRSGLPGIAQVPVLGHLFTSNSNSGAATDIVLTITPHIVRMAQIGEEERKAVWVGTERTLRISEEPPAYQKLSGETDRTAAPAPVPQPAAPDVSSPRTPEPLPEVSQPGSAIPETQPRRPEQEAEQESSDEADRTATISIDPSNVTVPPGTPFTLLVLVRASAAVGSCSFHLTIDPAMFQIVSLECGPTAGSCSVWEPEPGRIAVSTSPRPDFDGVACRLVLLARGAGLAHVGVESALAKDPAGNSFSVTVAPASIRIVASNDGRAST